MKTLILVLITVLAITGCGGGKGGSSGAGGGTTSPSVLPPTITAADMAGAEASLLSLHAIGSDPQGKPLTYSCSNCVTAGMSFNTSTGVMNWTPTYGQAGSYTLHITVSNGTASATVNPILTIAFTDRPPTFTAIGTQAVNEGANLTLTPVASDPDSGDSATISVVSGLPLANASWNGTQFVFNPNYSQAGSYSITFRATDTHAQTTDMPVTINVGNVSQAPTNNAPTASSVAQNQNLNFTVTGTPVGDAGAISYSATGLPGTATFSAGGVFNWTPACGFATGNYNIVFTTTDAASGLFTQVTDVVTVTALSCGNPTWSVSPSFSGGTTTDTVIVNLGSGTSPNGAGTLTYGFTGTEYDCNNKTWTRSWNSGLKQLTVTNSFSSGDSGSHWFLMYTQDSFGVRNYRHLKLSGYGGGAWTVQAIDQGTSFNTTGFCGAGTVYSH